LRWHKNARPTWWARKTRDKDGSIDLPGTIPEELIRIKAPVYVYEYGKLGEREGF
jgi:hypothetical protein